MKSIEDEKNERRLNKGQVLVLVLLYRYRFITSELLAKYENQKYLQVTRSRLSILEKRGYIGKRYNSSYKLAGKFASYYLLPKGLRYLKSIDKAEPLAIKMIYNDSKASDRFIEFCLSVFRTAQALTSFYSEEAKVFTRTELLGYDYFPKPQPDLYLSIKRKKLRHYFVDIYDDVTPAFVMLKKIKKYNEHYESGEWELTGSAYPEVIVACMSEASEWRLRKKLLSSNMGNIIVYTCKIDSLDSDSETNPFSVI